MKRNELRELAMRLTFSAGIDPRPAQAVLEEFLEQEYYKSLEEEDELYESRPETQEELSYLHALVFGVHEHLAELDSYIEKYAKDWKVGRISRVIVAICRVSMYEILYMPEIPGGVAINEAIEIAKTYEEANTVAFLNGILGSFIRGEMPQ